MNSYQGYQAQQQYQIPQQAMAPWAPQQMQPATPPPSKPTFEGSALAGILGAGIALITTHGTMFLANVHPGSETKSLALSLGMSALGGTVGVLGYRTSANNSYRAAQYQASMSGVSPGNAATALRFSGKLGKFGQVDVNIPTQTIVQAAKLWHQVINPNTPEIVYDYYNMVRENDVQRASQVFVQAMPDPRAYAQYQPQPQPQYVMYPPPQQQQQAGYAPPPPQAQPGA